MEKIKSVRHVCGLVRNNTSFPLKITAKLKELYERYLRLKLSASSGEQPPPGEDKNQKDESSTKDDKNPKDKSLKDESSTKDEKLKDEKLQDKGLKDKNLKDKGLKDKSLKDEKLAAAGLKYYQFLVRAVMTNPEYGIGECGNARGLLVYHTMGMGKTFLAVATAMAMWDVRAPLIIVSKSLQANFRDTIKKYVAMMNPGAENLADLQKAAVARFKFVSRDAYNMANQVARLTGGAGSLNDKLLIVDEAHNLFRAVINSPSEKTNARRLYEMVMEARNLRILFLTGTPVSKDPFELVPCFNMLAGYDLLPTQYDIFYRSYVAAAPAVDAVKGDTTAVPVVKNRGKLANRLVGMVSHVTHTLPSEPSARGKKLEPRDPGGFPEEHPTVIVRVEMSPEQYRTYLLAREKEEAESGGSGFAPDPHRVRVLPSLALPGSESEGGRSYYVKSRTLSNFAPSSKTLSVEEMKDSDFTAKTSPKAVRLLANIAKSPGPVLVYSEFVREGGLAVIARFLRKAGYVEYAPAPSKKSPPPGKTASPPGSLKESASEPRRFAIISGDVPHEDRVKIQARFNSPENAHGELIRALLVSKTGAEGLDLKGVRQVHVFEPYWDKAREDQVKARGVRLGSHDHLPVAERDVRTYLYIAVANARMFQGMQVTEGEKAAPPSRYKLLETSTIDEKFHDRATKKYILNKVFRKLLREVALECSINSYGDCRACVPTDAPLFLEDPLEDLKLPDPCQTLTEDEVAVEKIALDDAEFYFQKDGSAPFGVRFFEFSKEFDAYTPIDPSTGLFMRLLDKVSSTRP